MMREVNDLKTELGNNPGLRDIDLQTWIGWAQVELQRAQHNASYQIAPSDDGAICNVIKTLATLFLAVEYNAKIDT